MKLSLKPSLNWLLVFVPLAIILRFAAHEAHLWIFFSSCLAILPLAGWMGKATEHVAERTGEGLGGLLNATFGNAAELIIAIMALRRGLIDIVKASLTGSIIGNILLVLGLSFLLGGLRHRVQRFNPTAARVRATMLTLAAIALITPAAFHHLGGLEALQEEGKLSLAIALVLIVTYGLGLLFSLYTHRHHFSGQPAEAPAVEEGEHHVAWSFTKSFGVLLAATAVIAWISEILVGSVEEAAETLGMTNIFVGVVVVAVIGNAAEHSTAILVALKNRMDLSMTIAVGSSIQIALFVAPVLVFLSYVLSPEPLDLVFTPSEVIAVALAVAVTTQIAGDGESNWLEGVQLLAVYLILAMMFYFLPAAVGVEGH